MTKRKNLFITIFLVAGTLLIFGIYRNEDHTSSIIYNINTFSEDTGWGYDILENGKVIIHQDRIPVIQENKAFESEDQARSAAELVIEKIRENKAPTLLKEEIDKIMLNDK